MIVQRGDVYLARFPHASGGPGKKRPVLIVQADAYNLRLRHAVVAQITSNLSDKDDPACLLIEAASAEGHAAGLTRDSVVSGYLLSLMSNDRLQHRIGQLSAHSMTQFNRCLMAALELP